MSVIQKLFGSANVPEEKTTASGAKTERSMRSDTFQKNTSGKALVRRFNPFKKSKKRDRQGKVEISMVHKGAGLGLDDRSEISVESCFVQHDKSQSQISVRDCNDDPFYDDPSASFLTRNDAPMTERCRRQDLDGMFLDDPQEELKARAQAEQLRKELPKLEKRYLNLNAEILNLNTKLNEQNGQEREGSQGTGGEAQKDLGEDDTKLLGEVQIKTAELNQLLDTLNSTRQELARLDAIQDRRLAELRASFSSEYSVRARESIASAHAVVRAGNG